MTKKMTQSELDQLIKDGVATAMEAKAIEDKAAAETAAEQKDVDNAIAAKLKEAVDVAVAKELEPLTRKATENFSRLVHAEAKAPTKPGQNVARAVLAFAGSGGRRQDAILFASEKWGESNPVIKTLTGGSNVGGGFLVSGDDAAEIIELLRATSVIRSLNPTIFTMNSDTLPVPRIAGGSKGTWVGENTSNPASDVTFGQEVLRIKKLMTTVPISNDLIADADESVVTIVLNDIVQAMGQAEDQAFIRGAGTQFTPKGLRFLASPSQVSLSRALNDSSVPTLDEVDGDISDLVGFLTSANVNMIRPTWIFGSRSHNFLNFRVKDGNGNRVFKEELATGKLNGWPVGITNNIPDDLDFSEDDPASEFYLVDMSDVVIGDRKQIEIRMATEATINIGGQQVSLFDNDLTAIQAITRTDMILRHPESVAVKTNVIYGVN